MPEIDLYPAALRDLVEARGAAWANDVAVRALGYPALLITHEYESAAVLAAAEKEKP